MRAVTIWMRGRGLMVIPRTSLISPTPPHASSGPNTQSHNLHYLFSSNLALTVQPQLDLYLIYFYPIPTTQSGIKLKHIISTSSISSGYSPLDWRSQLYPLALLGGLGYSPSLSPPISTFPGASYHPLQYPPAQTCSNLHHSV